MRKTFSNGYALVIGVGADLPSTIDDAEGVASILKDPDRCGYPDEQVRLLTGRDAMRKDILRGLMWLSISTDEKSTVIVYFSGHGYRFGPSNDQAHYLLPNDYDLTRYKETCIAGAMFAGLLKKISARKLVLLLDCCHAAGVGGIKGARIQMVKAPLPAEALSLLEVGKGIIIIASSLENEYSHTGHPYSIFTQALVEVLSGQGVSRQDGFVRVADLALYAREVVPGRTADRQHPTLHFEHADNFVLAYYAGGNILTKPLSFGTTPTMTPTNTMKVDVDVIEGKNVELVNDDIGYIIHANFLNKEVDNLQQYFRKLIASARNEGFPKVRLVQEAENVWLDLKKRFGDQLPEPQAALALDGSLMFTWRRPGHYLEIEVFPDGHKEAFYENEITDTPWEAKITPSASLTDRVLEKLSIFMLDKVHLN